MFITRPSSFVRVNCVYSIKIGGPKVNYFEPRIVVLLWDYNRTSTTSPANLKKLTLQRQLVVVKLIMENEVERLKDKNHIHIFFFNLETQISHKQNF